MKHRTRISLSVLLILAFALPGLAQSRPCIAGANASDQRPRPPFIGFALASAPDGGLYFVEQDKSVVRRVTPDGNVTTVAGTGVSGFSGDGGPATSAQLGAITHIAADGAGNLFIAETVTPRVRKVAPNGIITTVAGNGVNHFSGDGGPATSASLCAPTGLAVDGLGNLYISFGIPGTDSDAGADYRIRRVTPDGSIHTYAGNGSLPRPGPSSPPTGDGGPGTATSVFARNIEADTTGNLYISDGARVRKVTADGIIRTIAGTGARGFSGDGGPATSAQLGLIGGIAVDGSGNLFISEFSNNRIRRVTRDGIISTVAGDGARGYTEDGGRAIAGQVGQPRGMTADALGNIFVVVQGVPGTDVATVFAIRKVSREGVLSTVFRQF